MTIGLEATEGASQEDACCSLVENKVENPEIRLRRTRRLAIAGRCTPLGALSGSP